jgi:hypothetical protein
MSAIPSPAKLAIALGPLLPRLDLDAEGRALLEGARDAAEGLARLEAADRPAEALKLIAHALPKREAVWWACMCARAVPDPAATPADQGALEAAELWVRRPEEAHRRAAMAAAEGAGFRSTEAWAAAAAFFSGGSISVEGQPAVPPTEAATAQAVAGAVTIAALRVAPGRAARRQARFIASAREIAGGGAGRIPPETD